MQVTVTDYKLSSAGKKVTVDTDLITSIYDCNGVFDGRSMMAWNVVIREAHGEFNTIVVDNDDIKLLRTVK